MDDSRIELRRLLGTSRVVVDSTGVTRRSLMSTRHLAWDDILDVRLAIAIRGFVAPDPSLAFDFEMSFVSELLAGVERSNGTHRYQLGMTLRGRTTRIGFGWRFSGSPEAMARVIRKTRQRLLDTARAELESTGVARFGSLGLAEHGIEWGPSEPLPRASVESVELFNSSPVRLRVMKRDKVFPFRQENTSRIPNIITALDLASELGYTVRGLELFAALDTRA